MYDLLHIARSANLVVVFHILPDDAALIVDILNPLDEFVAAARRCALLSGRRQARKDEDRNARFGRVVDGSAERLRPAVDMHDDRLGATRQLSVALSTTHRGHFVRTGDDGGYSSPEGSRLGDRLDQSGMITAEIGEDIGDARFLERLKHCRAGRIHSNDSRSFALLSAPTATCSFRRRTTDMTPITKLFRSDSGQSDGAISSGESWAAERAFPPAANRNAVTVRDSGSRKLLQAAPRCSPTVRCPNRLRCRDSQVQSNAGQAASRRTIFRARFRRL